MEHLSLLVLHWTLADLLILNENQISVMRFFPKSSGNKWMRLIIYKMILKSFQHVYVVNR